jgi:hypothetical protein
MQLLICIVIDHTYVFALRSGTVYMHVRARVDVVTSGDWWYTKEKERAENHATLFAKPRAQASERA